MSIAFLRSLITGFEWREGSADEIQLNCLADLAGGREIRTIAEIGFNAGFSAHNFLDANSEASMYSFDLGEYDWVQPAADHIDQTFPGRFVLTCGDSVHTVPEFHQRHPEMKFDLIFVDGGHEYAVARQDLLNMRDIAHPTTVLVLDDLVPWRQWGAGPARAWADLLEEGVLTCDEIWQDGRRVDLPAPPGERAWAVGRYLPPLGVPLDARNEDRQQTFAGDRDRLLAEFLHHPKDPGSVFYLAVSYFEQGDFVNAHKWFARRVEMGGWDKEVYYAMHHVAESMAELGMPWPDVQDAYLKAWEFRPIHAEPLYGIAHRYRVAARYRLGHLFAGHAAEIPLPEDDIRFADEDVYAWRITDEQAVCASWIDKHAEAFTLCRRLLARPDIPEGDRQRIARNRDVSVPTMINAASPYPGALAQRLIASPGEAEVVVSLVAGPERDPTEQLLNSFLNCCTDVSRVGRFLVVDAGLSVQDRATLGERYGFLEFAHPGPRDEVHGPGAHLGRIRARIEARFWLHLGQGWRFFAPENLITRLTAVLQAEPQVFQVGINFTDAVKPIGACAAEETIRRVADAGRYLFTDVLASGPAMFDTARLDRVGGVEGTGPDPLAELGQRMVAAGMRTASLDEVLCIAAA